MLRVARMLLKVSPNEIVAVLKKEFSPEELRAILETSKDQKQKTER